LMQYRRVRLRCWQELAPADATHYGKGLAGEGGMVAGPDGRTARPHATHERPVVAMKTPREWLLDEK
jgi:hypothetical protein